MEIAVNTLPLCSRFVIPFDLRFDGVNLLRTVIHRGDRLPVYDYRQGESTALALNGATATDRDTTLTKAAQTRGGSRYTIKGMSITVDGYPYVASGSGKLTHTKYPGCSVQPGNGDEDFGPQCLSVEDMRSLRSLLVEAFLQTFYANLQIDGSKRIIEMGPVVLYPGQGGAKDTIGSTNGDVFVANYMPIPEAIYWNPAGAQDSNLIVALQAAYDLQLPTWTSPLGTADGEEPDENNPEIPYANRTAWGREWSQGFILSFHGREESPLSNVA